MNSTSIGQQLMRSGLVDEFWLWLHPAVIGQGKALFQDIGDTIHLQLVESRPHKSGSIFLRYRLAQNDGEEDPGKDTR
jgi:dihydrofolate reductase